MESRNIDSPTARWKSLPEHPGAQLLDDLVVNPIKWLNPTRARYDLLPQKDGSAPSNGSPQDAIAGMQPRVEGAQVDWRARDNRKGTTVLIESIAMKCY